MLIPWSPALIDKLLMFGENYKEAARSPMPVNMDPSKKRRRSQAPDIQQASNATIAGTVSSQPIQTFGIETEEDREKELADAELRNLWEATEVIDMDKV